MGAIGAGRSIPAERACRSAPRTVGPGARKCLRSPGRKRRADL